MAAISTEQFNQQLQKQKDALNAIKWRELKDGQIYTIISIDLIDTQYGEACILNLSDGQRVFSPSALTKRLKQEMSVHEYPRYVRPQGRVQSKRNPAQTYYAFDLV